MFWQNWFDDISCLFLGKGSFASTYKAIYESKNVCVKKLQQTLDKEMSELFPKKKKLYKQSTIDMLSNL